MSWLRRSVTPLLIILAVFLLQWLLLFSLKGPTWDAVGYYIFARSAVFDGDLHFGNDFLLSYPTAGEHFASKGFDQITTTTGRVENIFAVGAPILWMPWMALLRLAATLGLLPGVDSQLTTGYEPFFAGNVALLSALIGLLAFLISYHLAEVVIGRWTALAATVTIMFTTPLLYYQYREPLYSHTASALAIALCVFVWWRQVQEERFDALQGLGLGALIGFAGLVRYQNLAYMALPAMSAVYWWISLPAEPRKSSWRGTALYLLSVGAGAIMVFAIQMSVWRVLFGTFFTIPFVEGTDLVDWRALFLDEILFSSFRGILPWMPVFFLSVVGLVALGRRKPQFAWPLLFMLLLAVYINGSTRDWFGGGGYGPRRLTSELIILVAGYAAFLKLIPNRIRGWFALLLGAILAMHQWLLLRYGLAESLGGRIISFVPDFTWEDEPLPLFFGKLARFVPESLQNPLEFFVFSGSPLDQIMRQQTWPGIHLSVLLQSSLFLVLVFGLLAAIRSTSDRKIVYAITSIVVLLVIVAQVWILNWA